MLQWMGGSRRKVTTSRKSTHTRQKQYFEQRKRQRQTIVSENLSDERSKRFNYYDEPRSLDVLSLNNLAANTQQQLCDDKNENGVSQVEVSESFPEFPINNGITASYEHLKDTKVAVSQDKINYPESFNEFPLNKGIAASRKNLMEPKKLLCANEGSLNRHKFSAAPVQDSPGITASALNCSNRAHDKPDERKMSSFSYPSNTSKNGAKADELKKISENQFSVLDFLSDDLSHGKSEKRPSGETHVAFSLKGLGKVRMETPAHSPGQVDSFCSPKVMVSRWTHSSQDLLDDLWPKPLIMDKISFSAHGSPSELISDTLGMKDYLLNSDGFIFDGNSNADAYHTQDDLCMIKENSRNDESKMEATLEDKFGMFEDLLDDRKYGASYDEQPFYMDFDVSKFSEIKHSAAYDFSLEDKIFQNRRSAEDAWKAFGVSDIPDPYLRNSTSVNDYNFEDFDLKRTYHWSFPTSDDATDDVSLLSEESCSSAAVRKKKTSGVETDLLTMKRQKRCRSKKVKNLEKNSNMKTFVKGIVQMDINEVLQDKNLLVTENNWTVPTKWTTETMHCLDNSPVMEEKLQAECTSFSREENASARTNLIPSFLHKSCVETDIAFVDCKFKSEDSNFHMFKVPKIPPDTDSSQRNSTPGNLNHEPCGRIHLEKNISRQPLEHVACLATLHLLKAEELRRNQSYCAESQKGQFLHMSSAQEDCKDNKLSDLQLGDCTEALEKPQLEISVGKSRMTSGIARSAVVGESRERYGEQEKITIKTPKSLDHSEVKDVTSLSNIPPAIENVPTSIQCFSSELTDGLGSSSHHRCKTREENCKPASDRVERKGDNKADTSYLLMLESYVLQLLCVQKVLVESSKQEKH